MAEKIKVSYSNGDVKEFNQTEFAREVAQQLCNDDSITNADEANKKFEKTFRYPGKLFSDTKWVDDSKRQDKKTIDSEITLNNRKTIYLKRDVWGKTRKEFKALVEYFNNNPQNPFFTGIWGLGNSLTNAQSPYDSKDGVIQNTNNYSFQIILYGAPGTGKSHKIKEEIEDKGKIIYRTTFHPDTDYATFIGCYKPCMDNNNSVFIHTSSVFDCIFTGMV